MCERDTEEEIFTDKEMGMLNFHQTDVRSRLSRYTFCLYVFLFVNDKSLVVTTPYLYLFVVHAAPYHRIPGPES